MHNPHRPARVADALRNLRRIVVHQHNIRRLDCGIRADAAHRNADIRAAQHRRIVDTIACERHGVAVTQQTFERAYFVLRQQLRAVVGQADLLGDVRRDFLAVAGQHDQPLHACGLQGFHRGCAVFLDDVADDERAEVLPAARDMHHRADFRRLSRLDADGLHQARVARVHLLAVHLRLYAVTRRFRSIADAVHVHRAPQRLLN